MTINEVKFINLPKFLDARGNLSFVENYTQIPFEIKRTYWLYDVPGGECRGGHAYKETEEFVIALSGAFDVTVDDGAVTTDDSELAAAVRALANYGSQKKYVFKYAGRNFCLTRSRPPYSTSSSNTSSKTTQAQSGSPLLL